MFQGSARMLDLHIVTWLGTPSGSGLKQGGMRPQKEDPSPREMLRRVFMTCVRLEPPRGSGRAAAAHWARLQQDAADTAAEHNRRALLSLVPKKCAAGRPCFHATGSPGIIALLPKDHLLPMWHSEAVHAARPVCY